MEKHIKSLSLGITEISEGTPSMSTTSIEKNSEFQKNIQNQNYERYITTVNEEKMSYIQLGNAKSNKDIVIVHGSAFSATVMISYGELYAKNDYNVILLDLPGHYGDVSATTSEFEDLGNSVAKLIKQLQKEKKIGQNIELQGWSLGGSVTLDVALRYPEIIKSVGIINGASNWHGMDLGHLDNEESKIASFENSFKAFESKNSIEGMFDEFLSKVRETSASYEACNNDYFIDKTLNIDDRLGEIKVPVNIFFGIDDVLSTVEIQNEMANAIKNSNIFLAENLGHLAVIDNPQAVYDAFASMRK